LMRAALAAARRLGVEFQENSAVREVRSRGNLVEVVTASGVLTAGAFIDCRGAWSGLPVRPRKGQMLYVQPPQLGLLQHVVHASEVYIVPRSSGKILLGATVEDVGFDKTVVPRPSRISSAQAPATCLNWLPPRSLRAGRACGRARRTTCRSWDQLKTALLSPAATSATASCLRPLPRRSWPTWLEDVIRASTSRRLPFRDLPPQKPSFAETYPHQGKS
jgi:glycine/D-amino acid oxidase-like deaminating enzyme